MITEEKNSIELKLLSQTQELELLHEFQYEVACSREKSQLLEGIIREKTKEVESLKKKLEQKEYELELSRQQSVELQIKLSKAQTEMRKKHDEILQLQRENKHLSSSCNIQREKVSRLIQLTAALKLGQEVMQVMKCDIVNPIVILQFTILSPFSNS